MSKLYFENKEISRDSDLSLYERDYIDVEGNVYLKLKSNKTKIKELKQELIKWKEDVEQVELFGMERTDYEQKKARCAEIILILRQLEKEL